MLSSFSRIELTPDQLFQIGFGDGLSLRPKDRKYRESLDYVMGHTQGYQNNPNSLFNVPAIAESPDEIGWGGERLNPTFLGTFSGDRPPMI